MLGTIPRHIWAGLSVAWLVILATNIWPSDHSRTVATRSSEPSPEMMLAFWRQERLLAELIEPHPLRVLPPPKPALPKVASSSHVASGRIAKTWILSPPARCVLTVRARPFCQGHPQIGGTQTCLMSSTRFAAPWRADECHIDTPGVFSITKELRAAPQQIGR